MAKTIGKAFKISKKDVKSYGYASPNGGRGSFARNGGVTAIAAVNGRGAHARNRAQSARASMSGLSRDERIARARKLTGSDRAAFAQRMADATSSRGRTTSMRTNASAAQIAAARRNIKRAIAAKRGGSHRPNTWKGESTRHQHAALRGWYQPPPYPSTRGTAAKRRGAAKKTSKKHKANSRRKKNMRTHRRNFSAKQRAAALRNLRKARAARGHTANSRRQKHRRNGLVSNRKRSTSRKQRPNRKHRRNFSAKQRAAALRNLRKARAAQHRPNRKRGHRKNARRRTHRKNIRMATNRKRGHRKNARRRTHRRNFSAKQRAAALRNLKKARAAQHRPNRKRGHRKNARRRTHRRNGQMANRRRSSHRRNAGGRRMRMNGKAFRRNEFMATAKEVLKIGALTTVGFLAHKAVTKVFTDQVLDRILGSSGAVTPPAPAATSGLEMFQPYRSVIGGAVVAALGVYATNKMVKDVQTKMFLTAGIATSFVHSLAVTMLNRFAPQASGYLSGHDATSVNLAAMYGLGAGASIMPEYTPIGEYFAQNGLGEYFAQNGLGEYFPQNGLGEYFAQNGLGAYTGNPDLMQAAAGYGTVDNPNSNIVDPGGDLDHQLSIAEAAAGVGSVAPYEAAAGFGRVQPFEAAAGFGAPPALPGRRVMTVPPTADTWIPGTSDGALWAGTVAINQGQSANEMNSAGILETAGNQGVFG